MERLNAGEGLELAVVVLDGGTLKREFAAWVAATRAVPRLAGAAVIVYAPETDLDVTNVFANVRGVIPHNAGVPALIAAVVRAGGVHAQTQARIARGSERIDATQTPFDLHAYARSKLAQYLGELRAQAVMQDLTADLPGARIVTTADLHEVARRLRDRGEIEAIVATLLAGRAALLDSDRTLRSS
jgi:hypothetical protein